MKSSSAPPLIKPPDQTAARNCLFTNLLVLPGLGSILAGRLVGWLQAPLALTGFVLTNVWVVLFAVAWFQTGEIPQNGGPHIWLGLLGVTLFAVTWVWSLITGLSMLRKSRGSDP